MLIYGTSILVAATGAQRAVQKWRAPRIDLIVTSHVKPEYLLGSVAYPLAIRY